MSKLSELEKRLAQLERMVVDQANANASGWNAVHLLSQRVESLEHALRKLSHRTGLLRTYIRRTALRVERVGAKK